MSRKAVAGTVCFLAASAALVAAVTYGGGDAPPLHAPAAPPAGPAAAHIDEADEPADDDGDEDLPVALADVPAVVLAAAQAALPGFVVTEAERETSRGEWIYSLEGTVDGAEFEIEVAADGSSTHIEDEDD